MRQLIYLPWNQLGNLSNDNNICQLPQSAESLTKGEGREGAGKTAEK